MRRHFIINPTAARTRGLSVDELRAEFSPVSTSCEVTVCRDRQSATHTTRQALKAGCEQMVALGGDGTANAIANGFYENGAPVRSSASLVVAGLGTGADYFRSLEPHPKNWKTLVLHHDLRPVDVGRVAAGNESRIFLNMASAGLSADIVQRKFRHAKFLPRAVCYATATLASLWQKRNWPVHIELDGQSLEFKSALTLHLCKGRFCGGGMKNGSDGTLDDGQLELVAIRDMSLMRALENTPKLYRGGLDKITEVSRHKFKSLRLKSPEPIPFETDGDPMGTGEFTVEVLPQALLVCVPKFA